MDLFVTWDGFVDENIKYTLEYRPYPTGGAWIVINNISNTYYNLENLDIGFYEIRVKSDCADSDSQYEYQIKGKSSCPDLTYLSYSVVSENDLQQTIRINFINNTISIKVKVTNLNTSQIVLQETRGVGSSTNIILSKTAGQSTAYKVEISNICTNVADEFIDMGTYNVVGPPAEISSHIYMYQNFDSADNCAPGNFDWNNKPNTGTRAQFGEPLPQALTVIFKLCTTTTAGTVCTDQNPPILGGPFYYSITFPAGTSSWAAQHYRTSPTYSTTICIIKMIPEVFNNGKKVTFKNAPRCTSSNPNLLIRNLNEWPLMPQPPCINGSS